MSMYSFFSAISSLLYLEMGIFIISRNIKDTKNRLLAISCACLAVSGACQAFIYSADDKDTCFFFYHIYSPLIIIPLCLFIHFSLILTKRDRPQKFVFVLYLPGLVYGLRGMLGTNIIKDFELRGATWFEISEPRDGWTFSYLTCYLVYVLFSLYIIYRWGKRSGLLKEKRQAKIITGGFLVSFTLNLYINFAQPLMMRKPLIPRISSIIYLFLLSSIWYSMFKFDFLGNAPSTIEGNPLWRKLSAREKMIIPLLYDGLTYKEAACRLYISEGTLRKHMENIYRKTGINNKTKLITEIFDFKKDLRTVWTQRPPERASTRGRRPQSLGRQ